MVNDRVLIADDSKLNQKLLTAILGDEYDYIYANNGYEVIDILAKNEEIDIILLDINMPLMDGFEVLKVLNEKHYIEHIPVVIISVENDDDFVKKAYELGATDYIRRPFNSIVVTHRVKNTLMLYSNQKRLVKLVENQIYEREKTNNAMINIFSNIIELRNHESGSHTLHVQVITNLLLHELVKITDRYKLSESDINLISSLSALHDIGKISVPESILNKPGKLTDEEWVIMKNHTVEGYEILTHANIEQNNQFMTTAKAICRWHHEKYDGRGYPDGLRGDEIPISAQVVSMADVYDALTSVRCYKRAYSHDEAILMILNGECGAFNPLLIDCLKNVSDELKKALSLGIEQYDFHKESHHMATEILSENDLPIESSHYFSENEQIKRSFFENFSSKGIQFEYDVVLNKVRLVNSYLGEDKRVSVFFSNLNDIKILNDEDWTKFSNLIKNTTREKPYVVMEAKILVNGVYYNHMLRAMTLWSNNSSKYTSVIGQFSNISDNSLDIKLNALNDLFDVVRLVVPINNLILEFNENNELVDSKKKCYEIWNREKPCANCTSLKCLSDKSFNSKVEIKNSDIYSVLSKTIKYNDKNCVLELAFNIDQNSTLKKENRRNVISSIMFLDFYQDSLTKAYTRKYLEDYYDVLNKTIGVMLLDVDGFKEINDNYGHQIGDKALTNIAKVINDEIKNKGIVIRYGGDEFLILFEKIEKDDFNNMLNLIKDKIAQIQIDDLSNLKLSVSIGGAYNEGELDLAINIADKKMYTFKKNRL